LFRTAYLIAVLLIWPALAEDPNGQSEPNALSAMIGDTWTGSLASPGHRIVLYDDRGFRIFPGVNFDQPFSCMVTCGICHQVQRISGGWHFSAGLDVNDPGRPGEPWIYWDCPTGTQIPLSYRNWPGTFEPNQLGLSDWWFVRAFGRHMPGGGVGTRPQTMPDPHDRWQLSGPLEINCLSCHDADPRHDQALFGQQIGMHNFRWAATATTALGMVEGAVQDLPDTWQPGDQGQLPRVIYDDGQFLPDNKVILQITRQIPNERCLFCHSVQLAGATALNRSVDVHVAAGMRCVDCHRNGLDHRISRGYVDQDTTIGPLTCEGCHLGKDSSGMAITNLHAPYPRHKGIPNVHLEKLSCTACHSGPLPTGRPSLARTSRAHALGTAQANASAVTLPHIWMPVFAKAADGKIYPNRLVWPAYWARLDGDAVIPIRPELVREVAGRFLPHGLQMDVPDWPRLSSQDVQQVLQALEDAGFLRPVYITGGRLYSLKAGQLVSEPHQAGRPYLWPLAHDVRPARSALGAVSCQDCHSLRSGFLFGSVPVDGPLTEPNECLPMMVFSGLEPRYTRIFAWTFVFRPYLKLTVLGVSALILGILAVFLLRAIYLLSTAAQDAQSARTGKDKAF